VDLVTVAILNTGRHYMVKFIDGAVSISVMVHANCVTDRQYRVTSLTSAVSNFVPQITLKATLASLLKLRADI
jgi:hypothetical protein